MSVVVGSCPGESRGAGEGLADAVGGKEGCAGADGVDRTGHCD